MPASLPRCLASPSLRCCRLAVSCQPRCRELYFHPHSRGCGLPKSMRNPSARRGGAFRGAELRRTRRAAGPVSLQFQKVVKPFISLCCWRKSALICDRFSFLTPQHNYENFFFLSSKCTIFCPFFFFKSNDSCLFSCPYIKSDGGLLLNTQTPAPLPLTNS